MQNEKSRMQLHAYSEPGSTHVISGIATDGRESGSRIRLRVNAWADDRVDFFFEVAHSSFWKRQK